MESEDLLDTLKQSGVSLINADFFCTLDKNSDLIRVVEFEHDCQFFSILWFKNMMTLNCPSGIKVMFDEIEHSGTWPNEFKRNLQFKVKGNVVAVLGLEKYPCYD